MTKKFAPNRRPRSSSGIGTLIYAGTLSLLAWTMHLFAGLADRRRNKRPEEVAKSLRDCITGAEDLWDWDDFTSKPIDDPRLESIRVRAKAASATESSIDFAILQQLLDEAEGISSPSE